MKLKEKADSKGLDVYEIPYKKGSAKSTKKVVEVTHKKGNKRNKKETNVKESSEDGYSSGDDDDDSDSSLSEETNVKAPEKRKKFKKAEDYLEERDVPTRKSDTPVDDNSDDDENCVHLSDMLDSDDLADDSDETESVNDENEENNDDLDDNDGQTDSDNDVSIDDNESGVEESDGMDELQSDEEEDLGNPDETGKLTFYLLGKSMVGGAYDFYLNQH